MATTVIQEPEIKTLPSEEIPECLIYEMADNTPIYYKGYQEVLKGKKETEEIMGSSFIQSFVVSRIFRFLISCLPEVYEVLTNELGIWFSTGNWRAADIAIYRKEQLQGVPLNNQYIDIPPKVVIEVDTKADLGQFVTSMDYYYTKTDALLDFGVEKVIWIYTDARKIMIAESQKDWITTNWDTDIHIIEDVSLNLTQLLSS